MTPRSAWRKLTAGQYKRSDFIRENQPPQVCARKLRLWGRGAAPALEMWPRALLLGRGAAPALKVPWRALRRGRGAAPPGASRSSRCARSLLSAPSPRVGLFGTATGREARSPLAERLAGRTRCTEDGSHASTVLPKA